MQRMSNNQDQIENYGSFYWNTFDIGRCFPKQMEMLSDPIQTPSPESQCETQGGDDGIFQELYVMNWH